MGIITKKVVYYQKKMTKSIGYYLGITKLLCLPKYSHETVSSFNEELKDGFVEWMSVRSKNLKSFLI